MNAMSMLPRAPRGPLALTIAAASATLALAATPAHAVSPDVVIAQAYGGGGNAGATLTNDYVELVNRGTSAVSVAGWSVQYAAAAGSSWQVTPLSGSIAPGGHYLVAEGAGAGGTTPLPTPQASGSIAMSGTAGKVALVTNATALTAVCGATCNAASGVRDYLGYGAAATNYEGSGPAPTLSNATAALRKGNGTTDTDDNAADFSAGTPAPAGGGSPPPPPPPPPGISARIHDIQGAAHLSPLAGQRVMDVTGVVTAVASTRFFLQDPAPDADPETSEAIVVFTNAAPTVAVGDAVTVAGSVAEFRPGGATGTNLTTTEIDSPTVIVGSHGNALPAATLVGPGGRIPPASVIDDDATGSVETSGSFDGASDGIDFWESLEGMRVRIDAPAVVGPTNDFGETPVVPAGSGPRTARGGIVITAADLNPERIVVDDALAAVPAANVGDTYAGGLTGVVDYGFGLFTLLPSATPTLRSGGLQRESTRRQRLGELAVATFNVENLSPLDPAAKFATLAGQIVGNLASPDLVALEEIQDNSGPTNNGVVAADQTLAALVAAIRAAGGPAYQWREIDPVDGQDGGQPGGNIRQAFLFRTDRGLSFVDRPGGNATTPVSVVNNGLLGPRLTISPGRIAPADAAFTTSRKPLAGEFRYAGVPLFVVANHMNSKGGDDPLFGRFQPPSRPSETQRHAQASLVRGFVDELLRRNRSAKIVVLGDINDFDFSETADILVGDGTLVDLPRTLPIAERYSYVFEGNSQILDHILLSRSLAAPAGRPAGYDYDIVHANSEFADQASDHDPQIVRLELGLSFGALLGSLDP
jgi:predicted extracellular nuclease